MFDNFIAQKKEKIPKSEIFPLTHRPRTNMFNYTNKDRPQQEFALYENNFLLLATDYAAVFHFLEGTPLKFIEAVKTQTQTQKDFLKNMTQTTAKYVRLTPSAQPPVRGTTKSAGLDVCADLLDAQGNPRTLFDGRASHELSIQTSSQKPYFSLQPGQRILIPIGLAFSTSVDVYTRIAPRSGLALKQGLSILGGVVDADYTGELGVICHNADPEKAIEIVHGMRIAQLVLEKVSLENPTEIQTLEQTDRLGGFGSTGV